MSKQQSGPAYIRKVLGLLFEMSQIVELRVPIRPGRAMSGYFKDFEKLAAEAAKLSGKFPGIYCTVNPVEESLFARSMNRLKDYVKETTADKQVLRRRFFLFDIDPVRPSGISSSETEHQAAIDLAYQVKAWLETKFGFTAILIADSGNGAHLMILVDLPNDNATTGLFKKCIEAVALHFEDPTMSFDRTIHNPARIWKLYGTKSCKGDNLAERPHRYSKILEAPKRPWEVTPVETFKRLAATIPDEPRSSRDKQKPHAQFDLAKWIADKGLDVIGPYPYEDGQKWIFRICPWNADHTNRSAVIIQRASGVIGARCLHNGCDGKGWHDLRDIIEPDWRQGKPDQAWQATGDHEQRPEKEPKPNLPALDAGDRDLKRIASETLKVLIDANQPPYIFRHADNLCRIQKSDDGANLIRRLSENSLRHILAQHIRWFALKRKKEKRTAVPDLPPLHVVRDILAMPEPPFPVVTRIVHAPIFASDGTITIRSGYSPSTRTYYDPGPDLDVTPVPQEPTAQDDVESARDCMTDILRDFPFVSESEYTHAIALFILPFARELIDGVTPLHLIEKPAPGTGAGLLAEVLTYPFLGASAAVMTEGRDEDEWRKRITAKLMDSNTVMLIDNVRRRLESSALSAAITGPVWEERLLGQNTVMIRVQNKVTWIATGNNPALSQEMARRTVRIRLDAKTDRAWERQCFKYPDLRGHVATARAELIRCALVLIQDWVRKGRVPGKKILGGFEAWSKTIGGIMENASFADFLGNVKELYERSDAEGNAWRQFVAAWWDTYKGKEVGVNALYLIVVPVDGDPLDLGLGEKSEQSQKSRLGKQLRAMRDRQFDGKRIVLADPVNNANRWRLEEIK